MPTIPVVLMVVLINHNLFWTFQKLRHNSTIFSLCSNYISYALYFVHHNFKISILLFYYQTYHVIVLAHEHSLSTQIFMNDKL
jgi:hypothetical protein